MHHFGGRGPFDSSVRHDGDVDAAIEDMLSDLERVSERIADLAIDLLRTSVEEGAEKAPASERKLAQARRAVEKAAHHLREVQALAE